MNRIYLLSIFIALLQWRLMVYLVYELYHAHIECGYGPLEYSNPLRLSMFLAILSIVFIITSPFVSMDTHIWLFIACNLGVMASIMAGVYISYVSEYTEMCKETSMRLVVAAELSLGWSFIASGSYSMLYSVMSK